VSLEEKKRAYASGKLTKPAFMDAMHASHEALFEYARLLPATAIEKIEVTDGLVVMTFRESGVRLICDPADKRVAPIEAFNFGAYEKAEVDLSRALIEPGASILDVGANVGFYSLTFARLIPDVRICAFEPIPSTFDYLRRHVALNGVANVRIFDFGFSDREGRTTFYFYPEGSGNASLANLSAGPSVREVVCPLRRLDDFVRSEGIAVDFLKCDVEGAELLVFRGGVETLRTHRPIVLTEMLRKWSARFGYHPNEIIELLAGLGYRCFTIAGDRLRELARMDESTVETNFFFLHGEKHATKIARHAGPDDAARPSR
jgi:FkbM family methyltransferase